MTATPVYASDLLAVWNRFVQRHGRDAAVSALYRCAWVTRIESVAPQDRAAVVGWLGRVDSGEIRVPAELPYEATNRRPYVRPERQPAELGPVVPMGRPKS